MMGHEREYVNYISLNAVFLSSSLPRIVSLMTSMIVYSRSVKFPSKLWNRY